MLQSVRARWARRLLMAMMKLFESLYPFQYRTRQRLAGSVHAIRSLSSGHRSNQNAGDIALDPERVLFILSGLIGDTVMCTPVLIEARRLWPHAQITILGQPHNRDLLAASPIVDRFKVTDAVPFSFRRRNEASQLAHWIEDESFDVAIILLGDQFAYMLAKARIPVRVGVSGHALHSCLTHSYQIGSARTWGPDERLNALRCLGYKPENARPQLWVDENARASAIRKLSELGVQPTPYAVIHPFGSTGRQWWPIDFVMSAADSLAVHSGLQIVLVGGPETRTHIPSSASRHFTVGCGAFDLPELLAIIEGASLVLSTDSGPFHIAGALGRPLVGLFRGTRPEHAFRYRHARAVFGQSKFCEGYCKWDRCESNPCNQMKSLLPPEVLSAARETLTGAAEVLSLA